jgi:hypothetical protein
MRLATRKMPLLVPLLEPVLPRAALQRTRNLPLRSMASQYATPNQTCRAASDTDSCDACQQETKNAVANGLRADGLAVKPHGTTRNRTFSAASGARAGRVRNSRDGNKGFFPNPPHPDGPRQPRAAAGLLPAAFVHALGNGTIADDGDPCPCRLPDTAAPPAAVTSAVPLPRRRRYSTEREGEAEKTTSRIPSRDKCAHDNG